MLQTEAHAEPSATEYRLCTSTSLILNSWVWDKHGLLKVSEVELEPVTLQRSTEQPGKICEIHKITKDDKRQNDVLAYKPF